MGQRARAGAGGGSEGVVVGAWEDGGSELGGAAGDQGGGGTTYRATSSWIVSRASRFLTPLAIPMSSALAPGQVGWNGCRSTSGASSNEPMRTNTLVRTSVFFIDCGRD